MNNRDNTPERTITWDAEKDFLVKYQFLMEKVRHGEQTAYYKVKELRIMEFRNTIEIVNQGHYTTESGKQVFFPSDKEMMGKTVFYEHVFHAPDAPQNSEPTIVEIQNIDCLYAGVQLKEQGYNPAVLNMASRRNPGGGVTTGAGAQEETLFRRTNLFRSLYQFAPYAMQYGITPSPHRYPLDRNFGGVYTPDAIYFRESEEKGYALLDDPVALSFISVAGMNRPDLTADNRIADHLVEPVKNKIRTIFRIGLAHGHDSLVLGALGCGAFCNPPRHVARLFHEVMDEPEFKNRYKKIVFAILDDHNTHHKHNPEGNFKPFAEEFAGMDTPQSTADQMEALRIWTMGAGNSAKRFNGENPIPPKSEVATKDSWKNLPMPDKKAVIPLNVTIPCDAMHIIKYGHIPEAMEDHWFMYCDDNTIRYYRSWTGICIYEAKYEEYGDGYRITHLEVNRNPEQYGSTDIRKDTCLFLKLLTEECGGTLESSEQQGKKEDLVNSLQDRIRGSLIGGAIGDALGYPVEFENSLKAIQHLYGERGITRLDTHQRWMHAENQTGKAVISDDTQMTLFTANGLLNAKRLGMPGIAGISNAYIEWYFTQTGGNDCPYNDCWITHIPELNARRAPGNTCLTALDSILRMRKPGNNSKGCGGVMRVAPIPLYAAVDGRIGIDDADRLAGDAAELTHKHPLGFIPAALMAHIIYRLATDNAPTRQALERYIREGMEAMARLYPQHPSDTKYMGELAEKAISWADNNRSDVENIEAIGGGWVGEEALAIALYCACRYFDNFEDALIASVNHAGDSDSTGAITGNILGAAIGYEAIPKFFTDDLELHDVILHMADDLYRGESGDSAVVSP